MQDRFVRPNPVWHRRKRRNTTRKMKTYLPADEITLVHSGEDYFTRLLELLGKARKTIHLHTYIFENDETGTEVGAALRAAAARGVQVRVLVDSIGSGELPRWFVSDMQAAGVEFRFFEQVVSLWKWRFGRTLHHKITVVDGKEALLGGINIAGKYRGTAEQPAWLDFAVQLRGTVCAELFQLCESVFLHRYWQKKYQEREPVRPPSLKRPAGLLRIRQNDWLRRKTEISQSYRQGIAGAQQALSIVASYFLPGFRLRRQLFAAARRGVEIKVLLTGPSDVLLARQAEQYLAYWLIRKGIRVFRWEKSVLHGKAIQSDGRWTSLGSYNINRLSRMRSVELNADILDPEFNRVFAAFLDDLFTRQCVEITAETLRPSGLWGRWKARLAYRLAYFLMRVLFPPRR